MQYSVPQEVLDIANALEGAGFSAYLVGGCVRDLLMGKEPKDWDITTNAKPEEIQKLFPESVYENTFGTVLVKIADKRRLDADRRGNSLRESALSQRKSALDIVKIADKRGLDADRRGNSLRESALSQRKSALDIVEVTTFRLEGKYTDKRHPDEIKFAKTVEEDLSRRDFTVNAIAIALTEIKNQKSKIKNGVIDPFSGQKDLEAKIIRAVGDPSERFSEDALRLLRAARFSAQLGFEIEEKTLAAINKNHNLLELISAERIRDEFSKLIMTDRASEGVEMLRETGFIKFILPELLDGVGVGQNKHHIYEVFEHNLRALDYAVKKNYSLEVRLASLLHDVGKPRTKRGEGPDSTFYNHEVVGAKMVLKIMDRLRFSKDATERVAHLVRWHMFYYNVGEVSEAGVRRFLRRIGPEHLDDLLKVREADRIGSGVPKAVPYKMRHLLFMIDKVKRDPISPKALKINGEDVMRELKIEPSPRIGHLLTLLLEEVIEKPALNERASLIARLQELNKLTDAELLKLRKKAEATKEEFEAGLEAEMKKKHWVK